MKFAWRLTIGLLALVTLSVGTVACGADSPIPRSRLEKRVYRNAEGESLPYRLFVPGNYDSAKKYPIILFLHGAGERGDDNEAQLKHAGVLRLVSDEVAAKHPCFLVAPQCPEGDWWGGSGRARKSPAKAAAKPSDEPTKAMRLTMALLDALDKEYSIDPARRYVTGLSMGGFGSFYLCARRPKDFAAAMPICGGGDDAKAKDMARIAFWIFHGDADSAVPPDLSRKMVDALKEAGAKVKYTEYPGVGHDSWTPAYKEPDLVDWLFRQRREPGK